MKLEQWGCIFIFLFIKFASFSSVSTQVLMSCLLAMTVFHICMSPNSVCVCTSCCGNPVFVLHGQCFSLSPTLVWQIIPSSATFKPFSRWAAIRNKQEGVSTSQTGGWDAPSSLGLAFIEHIWVLHQYRLNGKQHISKYLFLISSHFYRQIGENDSPFFPSIHINIKHLQTAAACVWIQQCEMVAMSVKLQSRGQKCDCVCPDVFKPLWF